MKKVIATLASLLLAAAAFAENTIASGTSVLFRGSTNLGTFANQGDCIAAAQARTISSTTTYQCRENLTATPVVAPPPPPPPPPPPTGAVTYSTNFDAAEYPLSEGGRWFKAPNAWTYVRSEGGVAYGTNGITNSYDDSVAFLSGFGADQGIEAVVQVNPGTVGETHEVELWLRGGSDSNNLWGYELCFWRTGQVQIGLWEGPFGAVSEVYTNMPVPWTPAEPLKTGDVIKADITGNVISVYINGVLKNRASNNRFATGQPGIGFFIRPGGSNNLITLTSVRAWSN